MKNNFIENINDEKYFYSFIEDIEKSKVGFYSVGLYPASLAYTCAMHGKSNFGLIKLGTLERKSNSFSDTPSKLISPLLS